MPATSESPTRRVPRLTQHGGHRAAAAVQLGLDDVARREGVGVGLELEHVGLEQDGLQQVVDTGLLAGGHVDEHVLAAPLLGDDAVLGELLAHAVRVRIGLVALVDRDDDGHTGRLGVVDGLDGLGHDAVVGGDDQDDHVGDLGAAGAHGGERLVARGVDEGDLAAVDRHLGGADVLRDAAGLVGRHAGVADGVEQARLAVVDVAHDGDHGRARLQVGRVVVEGEGVLLLRGDDADLTAQVVGDELDEVVGHGLGHGQRGAQQEQALDDVVGGHVERLGELLDGDALGHADRVEVLGVHALGEGLLELLLLAQLRGLALALLLALLAAAGGLAAGLLDGGAGLLEDALAAVLLRLAGHAGVMVAVLVVLAPAALLAAAGLLGRGDVHAGGHLRGDVGAARAGGRGRLGAALRALAAAAVAAMGVGLGLPLGLGLLLLLEHGLLLGDLVEQRPEARAGVGGGHRAALRLELGLAGFGLRLLAGGALGLGGRGAGGLLGGLGGLGQAALLLAAALGGQALGLGGRGAGGLLGGGCLLLGLLGGLDLGAARLEHRRELLAHHGHVGVLERRRRRLRGDLHLGQMVEQLLG